MSRPPKRPLNSFMLWLNATGRKEVKNHYPELEVPQIGRKTGAVWRRLDKYQKAAWKKAADEEMQIYLKAIKLYNSQKESAASSKKVTKDLKKEKVTSTWDENADIQ